MDGVPTGQESQETTAASVSVYIRVLDFPSVQTRLAPCPDWPDLN